VARAVGAEVADALSLEEVELVPATVSELKGFAGVTYVPATSHWVRMGDDSPVPPGYSGAWFLQRADAQLLAKVLLELDLHAQGYLVGGNKKSRCRQTLCNAAESLPQLLGRLIQHIELLGLQKEDERTLLTALEKMMTLTLRVEYSRAMSAAIFELDQALHNLAHPNPKVDIIIGVLMITNAEFRSMIAQSARHLDISINSGVDVDFGAGSLNIQAVFGIMQPFPFDLDVLFPNEIVEHNIVRVKYSAVILSALKASLRSAFLVTSMDSLPLFELVMSSDGLVHFG
jgi:hypothetical protein